MSCSSTYAIAVDVAWLTVLPSTGTSTSKNDRQMHNLTFDVDGLDLGAHTGMITITDAAATNSPITVSVTLIVTAVPSTPQDNAGNLYRYSKYVRTRQTPINPHGD